MKTLQKTLSFVLLGCLAISLVACGPKPEDPASSTASTEASTAPTVPTLPEQKVLVNTAGMTDLQKAVVITAESYFLREEYAQYSQQLRECGAKGPEDYTEQNVGYTDCSAFVYDVYLFALGMDMSNGPAYTGHYCDSAPYAVLIEEPIKNKFSDMTEEERAAKLKAFRDTLQPGDVIVYRSANNSSGHAMLYVGDGMMIHSTGSDSKKEANGTFLYEPISTLLSPNSQRSILNKRIYVILRPLLGFNGKIPTRTLQRMNMMRGIRAEKLSSHNRGQTVTPGETITFTFRIANRSNLEKQLSITDTVPANTLYLSGAQTVSENQLSWSVTVPAYSTVEVSYNVQVDPAALPDNYVYSRSYISDIPVNCPNVRIAGT